MVRLVVPITASSMDEAISQVNSLPNEFALLKDYYDSIRAGRRWLSAESPEFFYEWRADCIKPAEIDVEGFAKAAGDLKGIFTLRHLKEAGPNKDKFGFKGDEDARRHLFEQAIQNKFAYVDMEINHKIYFDTFGKSYPIFSYHNFEIMPTKEALFSLNDGMRRSNAIVRKFALTPQSKYDLENLDAIRGDNGLVVVCMGEIGRKTRLNPKNYFTYTPLKTEGASANGQYTARETIDLMSK